jgi:hypothetical protein
MDERIFTVDEANALLPELERAFEEIEELREELDQRMDRIKILDALWGPKVQEPQNPDREEFLSVRAGIRRVIQGIERMVDERLLVHGIRFPVGGLEHGLVDFATTFEGRTVYLCWRRGEQKVGAWHERSGGFSGRRPLTEEQSARMGRGEARD